MANTHKIPDSAECFRLMDAYDMPSPIRQHSVRVRNVALSIARALENTGEHLNIEEVEAAALLHDITKAQSLRTGQNHAESGADVLAQLGYARIADIVRQHVIPHKSGRSLTEAELVCYADKRVLHDRIVSLDERFAYLTTRYARDEKIRYFIKDMEKNTRRIESKIVTKLAVTSLDDLLLPDGQAL